MLEIFGTVYIDRDAREAQHHARSVCGLGGSVMRLEAVVAEAQRKQSRGTAVSGVGAASVGGGDQNAAFRGSLFQNLFELPRLNQRNIGGDHQCAGDATVYADLRGHFDSAGLARVCRVGNDFEVKVAG